MKAIQAVQHIEDISGRDLYAFGTGAAAGCVKWLFTDERTVFEREFADYIGVRQAVGTSYGRTALYLGLKALGVRGKEVLLPAFTCAVVRQAVVLSGARPRFVDIDERKFDLNMEDLDRKVNQDTRAVVLTHYFGGVAGNMDDVINFSKDKGIAVIEDCAHSLGAAKDERKVGSFGDFAIFSLTKGMVNCGGGMLATNDEALAQKAREILWTEKTGWKRKIVDFPMVMAYGLKQMGDKLADDRVGKAGYMDYARTLESVVLKMRSLAINSVKGLRPGNGNREAGIGGGEGVAVDNQEGLEGYPVEMERIMASIGRRQVRSMEQMHGRRKSIYHTITDQVPCAVSMKVDPRIRPAYTSIVFRKKGIDLQEFVKQCKERGLVIRPTWPTHQVLWKEQDTRKIEDIGREVFTWNINPRITPGELKRLVEIINPVPKKDLRPALPLRATDSQVEL